MPALRRIALVLFVAVAGLLAGLWFARQQAPTPLVLEHATLFPAPRALPGFELLDHAGRPFRPERLAGRWSILFFGFTQCPDVCPSTLAALAAARRELADLPPAQHPQVVLVSVDPARDTPERLAGYVRFFDESFTGVTGEPAALAALTRELGVAVLVGEADENGQYTIDHTAALFLVNPEGALAAVFVIVRNPPGYFLASGRHAVSLPFGDESTILAVAEKFGADYLVLEEGGTFDAIEDLYNEPDANPSFGYLGEVDGARLYRIEIPD